jgi:2-haloacid dehalogenase/putative hydrolase of the HAD superfamily
MVQDVVFDLGSVVFRWPPLVLLQEVFPKRMTNETVAANGRARFFKLFTPRPIGLCSIWD